MSWQVVGEAIALFGALLTLLAALGVVRFRDILERMHAVTKASTLGLLLVLVGAACVLPAHDATTLALAGILQVITLPVGAFLIGRATYRSENIKPRVDTVDELADAERHGVRFD